MRVSLRLCDNGSAASSMDEQEKRSIFNGFQAHLNKSAPSSSSDEVDSSSSSSIGSSIHTPTASPPRQHQQQPPQPPASPSSSDTSTVKPNPPRLSATPPPSHQPAPSPASPSSANSSQSTVPPPSPAAWERFRLATSPSALQNAPLIVTIDNRGIDGWEADQASRHLVDSAQLAAGYPKLSSSSFRFSDDADNIRQDIHLSNMQRSKARTASWEGAGILPKRIAKHLSSYQRDGVIFMYRLYERGRGGLLADAMGLGKTIQTVCFLGSAFGVWNRLQSGRVQNAGGEMSNGSGKDGAAKVLVIVRASTRENWKNEFERWTPFRVRLYDRAEEGLLSRGFQSGEIDVLVTGYTPVSNYFDGFFSDPCGTKKKDWKWDVVIVDEIHEAKNPGTKTYKSLQALPKGVMFGLTGTAVQNKLKELWAVMSLVVPDELWMDRNQFKSQFEDVIKKGTKRDASDYMRRKAQGKIEALRKLLGKHMVRRPKSIIEEQLPGKTDYCVLMRMKREGLQGYMYRRFQNSYDVKLLRDANSPCDCGSMIESKECCHRYPTTEENLKNAPIWRMHHKDTGPCSRCPNCICLYLQHYSRCLAAHALLLLPEDDEPDVAKAEFRRELFKYYLGKHADKAFGPLVTLEQEADVSCKLNVALRLIKKFEASGHKTIIFYESLRLGAILQRWATNKGLIYEIIDGSVNKGERQGAVDRFNTNSVCSIFFISKKAGGTGLNICGADRVLIFEPCWNPTLDLQAGDRAHRLGQKRVVHILRLVVENTIEHYVFKTAISKSQLSSAILDNTKEEWRIREGEVGSMHAMLRMGDVFTSDDPEDDFHFLKADELNKEVKNGKDVNLVESGFDKDLEHVEEDAWEEGRVLGDEIACSLDVDIDNSAEQGERDGENGFVDPASFRRPESQLDADAILMDGEAGGQLVMSSTSARKRRRQVMGVSATHRNSGINPCGAEGVNFDDASWKDIPMSQEADELSPKPKRDNADDEPPVMKRTAKRPPLQKRPSSSGRGVNDKRKAANAGGKPNATKQEPAKRQKTQTRETSAEAEKPKARSAFAARARVRR